MAEAFTGHRIVKAYNLEPIVAGQFQNAARRYRQSLHAHHARRQYPGPAH